MGVQQRTAVEVDESELIDRLLSGDEDTFSDLLQKHYSAMIRLASVYAKDRSHAEEIVQETWLSVLNGLERFQARSSLKTWIFSILVNQAKTYAKREGRWIQYSTMIDPDTGGPSVPVERFYDSSREELAGRWARPPKNWDSNREEKLLGQETRALIESTMEKLPPSQREVLTVRDIEGCTSEEACNLFGLTKTNQRVLLHRARSKVRQVLENYFEGEQRSGKRNEPTRSNDLPGVGPRDPLRRYSCTTEPAFPI